MNSLQKSLLCGSTKVDNRMSKNTQNIQQSYKLHHKSHGKLKNGMSNKKTNPSKREKPKGNLPGIFILTTVIFYINDATQLYTYEMHRGLKINKITRKD